MSAKSYQDLDTRLCRLERLVEFVAGQLRARAVYQNGIIKPDGTPMREVFEGSMLDLFKLQQVNDAMVVPAQAGVAGDVKETY